MLGSSGGRAGQAQAANSGAKAPALQIAEPPVECGSLLPLFWREACLAEFCVGASKGASLRHARLQGGRAGFQPRQKMPRQAHTFALLLSRHVVEFDFRSTLRHESARLKGGRYEGKALGRAR